MLKRELERHVGDLENQIDSLKQEIKFRDDRINEVVDIVDRYTKQAVDELDPCADGFYLINELRKEVGLGKIGKLVELKVIIRATEDQCNDISTSTLKLEVSDEDIEVEEIQYIEEV